MRKLSKFWRLYLKFRTAFIPSGPDGDLARGNLYLPFLPKKASNFKVATNAFIYNPNKLFIGNNVYIGFSSYIGNGEIHLEDEVLIGNFVSITATNHSKKKGSYRFGSLIKKPITIGKGTWIGAHACILAGVIIGKGSLIAAGAIVTKSFPANTIIGGIPANIIKS